MSGSSSTIRSCGFAAGALPGAYRPPHFSRTHLMKALLQARFAYCAHSPRGAAVTAHAALLQHRDRGAQLLDVGEHVRGEEKRPALRGERCAARISPRRGRQGQGRSWARRARRGRARGGTQRRGRASASCPSRGCAPAARAPRPRARARPASPARARRRTRAGERGQELDEFAAAQVVRRHEALRDVGEAAARLRRRRAGTPKMLIVPDS